MTEESVDVGRQTVSIREAAAALGVSEKTVRRRVKTGELEAIREEASGGFVWRVYADQVEGTHVGQVDVQGSHVIAHGDGQAGSLDTVGSQTVQALLEVLREKDATIARLQADKEGMAAQLGMFTERTANLSAQLLLLQAPAPARPWWQFWKR